MRVQKRDTSSLADRVARLERELEKTRELVQSDMKKLIEIINRKGN
jgi:hypothetical protein